MMCRQDELDVLKLAIDNACDMAVKHVLGDFKMKTDISIYDHRFEDEDGEPLWTLLVSALKDLHPYSTTLWRRNCDG